MRKAVILAAAMFIAATSYFVAAQIENAKVVYVKTSSESVRSSPDGAKIGALPRGTKLNKLEQRGEWAHVRLEGWINMSSLSVDQPSEAATTETVKDNESQTVVVYITKTGSKYHRSGCRYLRSSSFRITLKEAKQRYSPCSVCGPPG